MPGEEKSKLYSNCSRKLKEKKTIHYWKQINVVVENI
jgi:hypothetical protein